VVPFEISAIINRIMITNMVPDRLVRRAMRYEQHISMAASEVLSNRLTLLCYGTAYCVCMPHCYCYVSTSNRWMMWDRLREYSTKSVEAQMEYKQAFVKQLRTMPVAIVTDKANEQHYEVGYCARNECMHGCWCVLQRLM
jgi:hypothetical protein